MYITDAHGIVGIQGPTEQVRIDQARLHHPSFQHYLQCFLSMDETFKTQCWRFVFSNAHQKDVAALKALQDGEGRLSPLSCRALPANEHSHNWYIRRKRRTR